MKGRGGVVAKEVRVRRGRWVILALAAWRSGRTTSTMQPCRRIAKRSMHDPLLVSGTVLISLVAELVLVRSCLLSSKCAPPLLVVVCSLLVSCFK